MAFENVQPIVTPCVLVADVTALKALVGPFTQGEQRYVVADAALVQWESTSDVPESLANGIIIPNAAPPTGRWVYAEQPYGVPGGSSTSVQYNDGGFLGGDANFTWNKTTRALTLKGIASGPGGTFLFDEVDTFGVLGDTTFGMIGSFLNVGIFSIVGTANSQIGCSGQQLVNFALAGIGTQFAIRSADLFAVSGNGPASTVSISNFKSFSFSASGAPGSGSVWNYNGDQFFITTFGPPVFNINAITSASIAVGRVLSWDGTQNVYVALPAPSADELVKVSAADTGASYLENKLFLGEPGLGADSVDVGAGVLVRQVRNGAAAASTVYTFDSATADADPGFGKFRLDNATQNSATFIYVNDFANEGSYAAAVLGRLRPGTRIRLQQTKAATLGSANGQFKTFRVTGDVIDAVGYVKIPVAVEFPPAGDFDNTQPVSWALFNVSVPEGATVANMAQIMWWDGDTNLWTLGPQLTSANYFYARMSNSGQVAWEAATRQITSLTAALSGGYNTAAGLVNHYPDDAGGANRYLLGADTAAGGTWTQTMNHFVTAAFKAEGDGGNKTGSSSMSFTSNKMRVTLTGNWTISSWSFPGVGNFVLRLIQDGTGGRTVTFPANTKGTAGVVQLGSGANAQTVWGIYYDGTTTHITSAPNVATVASTTAVP
jgi:hypothetical protein